MKGHRESGRGMADFLRMFLQLVARSYGKITILMVLVAAYVVYVNTAAATHPAQAGLTPFSGVASGSYAGYEAAGRKRSPGGGKGKARGKAAGGKPVAPSALEQAAKLPSPGSVHEVKPPHAGEESLGDMIAHDFHAGLRVAGALAEVKEVLEGASFSLPSGSIEMYSLQFYLACAVGGVLSCGLTHMIVTPLDVAKCNMQTHPEKYPSVRAAFRIIVHDKGIGGLFQGWGPTLMGYSLQGSFKFGLYELFKKSFGDFVGAALFATFKDVVYLAASACAEFIADVFLCPFEAVKVKVQTVQDFGVGVMDGMPRLVAQEGWKGLYRGLSPLWGRQIPYTMMKFASFERVVELIYAVAISTPKSECTKLEQLLVSFLAGYIAGVLCAVVSHPADNLVSKLNAHKGQTVADVVNQVGWLNLFTRGLALRILMVGTLTGLQWGIYDSFKVYVGLPTTGASPELPFPMAPPSPPGEYQ